MPISDGGDGSRVSGPMTTEERKLVEQMNRNLRQTGHTNPDGGRARKQSKEENTNSKSTERK